MPIAVTCTCGKSFRAKDELAGKRVRCPGCGGVLEIASAAPKELVPSTNGASHPAGSWNPASPALSPSSIANQPVQRKPPVQARPVMAVAVPQFPPIVAAPAYYSAGPPAFQAPVNQGAQGYGLSPAAPPTHSYQFTPAPSTSMTERAKSQSAADSGGEGFGTINAGVVGGIFMMIVAVAWFGIGLMANRIFFYPPVLFILGLVSVFKGLMGGR